MEAEQIKNAMLMMGELVLKDLQQSPHERPLVYYLECARKFVHCPNQPLLSMDKGDNLISFEPPFVTTCYDHAENWVFDAPLDDGNEYGGMYMSWAMKYIITLHQQIQVTGFGLVFNQVCTDKSRVSKGPYLANLFKELLAMIGEQNLDGLNSRLDGDCRLELSGA